MFFSILKSILRKVCNELLKKVDAAEILCRFAGCFIYLSQSPGQSASSLHYLSFSFKVATNISEQGKGSRSNLSGDGMK
jgi:hypothetical protein